MRTIVSAAKTPQMAKERAGQIDSSAQAAVSAPRKLPDSSKSATGTTSNHRLEAISFGERNTIEPVARVRLGPMNVAGSAAPAQFQTNHSGGNGTGLPDRLKIGAESLSGISLDKVKVHYNSPRPAQLNALAYAQGTDIHVAPGQERHLPHEAWHVIQQVQGRVQPTMQMKGEVPVNDDAGLEHEADVMGARVMSGSRASGVSASLPAQRQVASHVAGCGCAGCAASVQAQANAGSSGAPPVFQLTCDAGHPQHKKGPCPDSAEGKVARMASKHHAKTGAKGTPKKRLEKREQERLEQVKSRLEKRDDDDNAGGGGGGGIAT